MASHAELVLSAILSKDNPRRDLLATASVQLEEAHFYNELHRNIFTFLIKYFDTTNEVIPLNVFTKALEDAQVETAKVLSYSQTFEALQNLPTSEAEFKWSVQELKNEQAKRLTGIAITEAMEILERGYEVDRELYKGHEDARRFLTARVNEIERIGAAESTPEGNIFEEGKEIVADYFKRRDGELGRGINFGISTIDVQTGGMQRGEFILAAGFSGTGKSQFSTQAAWSCAVEQGKNVFFATSETVRDQVIRRLLARHSRLPQFGRPEGLNSRDIKMGHLTPEDEKVLAAVVYDWTHNKAYGKLHILQVPRGATLSYVEARLHRFGLENECDLVVDDYLALLRPEHRRGSQREELNEILKEAKLIATSFNDGQGVPFLSPWQINREGQKGTIANGFYTMDALADTSEAEKSADQIITLYREQENTRDVRLQYLKMRDDVLPPMVELSINFRSTYIGPQQMTASFAPANTTIMDQDIMALLD